MESDEIWEYSSMYTAQEPELLKKIYRETNLFVVHPRMISGHVQGSFLRFVSKMIQPSSILEIGTYTGYSALCLADGLQSNGKLITIERDIELEDRIRTYFSESITGKQIELIIGDAKQIIPKIRDKFDLIFIDADKKDYPALYNLIFPKVKKGGYILADNVLWGGKVLKQPTSSDIDTQGIIQFNEMVKNDERVENVLLPFRDGIMLIRKI